MSRLILFEHRQNSILLIRIKKVRPRNPALAVKDVGFDPERRPPLAPATASTRRSIRDKSRRD